MKTVMQFRLAHLLIAVAIVALFFAIAAAKTWQLSLLWAAVVVGAAASYRLYLAYREKTPLVGWSDVMYIVLALIPSGIVGMIANGLIHSSLGSHGGYLQSCFAGMTVVVIVGVVYPGFTRAVTVIGWYALRIVIEIVGNVLSGITG